MEAVIAELGQAPGKSMRAYEGIDVDSLDIDHRGLFGDREYMWVEAEPHTQVLYKPGRVDEPGRFLSQREDPCLTGISPFLTPKGLLLNPNDPPFLWVPRAEDTAINRIPVSVWGWSGEAVDQGDEAAAWGKERIGRSVRLVALSDERPRYVEGDPALGRVGFADGYPLTVGSTASIQKINDYLTSKGRPSMPVNRARANIILDGIAVDDPEAFPEDYIESITVATNGLVAVLRRLKACSRCPIPDTDQITGDRKTHIRSALGKLGRNGTHINTERYGTDTGLFFTQNFIIELPDDMPEGSIISIERGSKVEVTYSDTTNWVRAAA